ncbi:Protein of unknown function [Nocardioides alpinus]|uniref:DUF3152 domain-containing protein n=1 Tax=Nocardioides alpinus TaxID=748909 RepID=A0A1I0V7X9_9ACTN|nr:DUF3152 domain-containing protein [Nocardioides alpinus]PKH37117.1 hypothetical protein CXG46_16600 [Nocardioides alpinus]SFA72459.1 Protein of unknown function [Nocardioides alpinus]
MIRLTAGLATALALLLASLPPAGAAKVDTTLPELVATEPPAVDGTARQGRTLKAFPGRWTPEREETRYRWLRDGVPIRGAKERRHRLTALDVGARISLRVQVRAAGHAWTTADSPRTRRVDHATPVRRRVTYSVTSRGRIATRVRAFARLAQETYDDARGWRAGGVQFRRVPRGGDFTLVLAEARLVPSFSPTCSATWSCRVGRFVIINQERWKHASPAWNAAGRSLRDYRHLVVNHETGHWLGRGHVGCSGSGPAPVMMQQSKGTGGCSFNPWPLPWER